MRPVTPSVAPASRAESKDGAPTSRDDHVVSRRVDEGGAGSARTLRAVRSGKDGIVLSTDGEVGKIEIIELRDPSRLVLDLHGVSRAPKGTVKLSGAFTQVRFGKDDGRIRAVLDAAGELPKVRGEARRRRRRDRRAGRGASGDRDARARRPPTPSPRVVDGHHERNDRLEAATPSPRRRGADRGATRSPRPAPASPTSASASRARPPASRSPARRATRSPAPTRAPSSSRSRTPRSRRSSSGRSTRARSRARCSWSPPSTSPPRAR